ncbi:MAG: hypothetical protein LBM25_02480 [Bacteroidales bacterium]|jgi:hypothetical protein|nr:hypothetical protein [Bacteroidales bacterium]
MKENYDKVNFKSNNPKERIEAEQLIEEVCDRLNLHNYFGIFSVVIEEVLNLIYSEENSKRDNFSTTLIFEQCVNGVCFSFHSNETLFNEVPLLVSMLTNQYNIIEEGKCLELIFYVNGIDVAELKVRQDNFKLFFHKEEIETTK